MRLPILDYWRHFLALEVFVMHAVGLASRWEIHQPVPLPPVPCFLAISGFVILDSYQRNSAQVFWCNRTYRIMPAFILSLLLVWVLFGIVGVIDAVKSYFTGWALRGEVTANIPLWSLLVEEVIYGLMFCVGALGFYANRSVVALCTVSIVGLSFLIANLLPWKLFILTCLVCAFLIGNSFLVLGGRNASRCWQLVGLVCVTLLTLNLRYHWVNAGEHVGYLASVVLGSIGVLLTGSVKLRLPFWPDISYGMYIYHFPILFWLWRGYRLSAIELLVCGGILTLLAAVTSSVMVERPILARRRNSEVRRSIDS